MSSTIVLSSSGGSVPRTEAAAVSSATSRDKLLVGIVFVYWLAYENVLFFYAEDFGGAPLLLLTNAIKLLLPFLLLAMVGLPRVSTLTRGMSALYTLFFAAFLAWSVVPTALSGDPMAWLKILPRFVFLLAALSLFSRRPQAFGLFAKCVIVYVLIALAQWVLVYLTAGYATARATPNGIMAGPFGLFGNVTGTMYFIGAPFPFVRLAGFWNEPSNAAASAFAAYFLARYLAANSEGRHWRHAATACGIAGLLTFSNAGYLAFAVATMAGLVFGAGAFDRRRILKLSVAVPISVAFLVVAVFGRSYVVSNMPDNIWARAITGTRGTGADYDPSNGRIGLLKDTQQQIASSSIGIGLQEVGGGGIEGSASAPVFWLLLTGLPGLGLLLAREASLLAAARHMIRHDPASLALAQALLAVMAQQSIYGSWMNPNYFLLAAAVLVSVSLSRSATHAPATS